MVDGWLVAWLLGWSSTVLATVLATVQPARDIVCCVWRAGAEIWNAPARAVRWFRHGMPGETYRVYQRSSVVCLFIFSMYSVGPPLFVSCTLTGE